MLAGLVGTNGFHPVDDGLAGVGGRLLHRPRRHLAGGELLHDEIPMRVVGDDSGEVWIGAKVELRGGGGSAMAGDAIGGEERTDSLGELTVELCVGRYSGAQRSGYDQ
jgi:hypothetical protein